MVAVARPRRRSARPAPRAKLGVLGQMQRLAMGGNGDARPRPVVHLAQLAAARMAGDVDEVRAVGDDLDALLDQAVDDACRPPSRCRGWCARRRSPGRPATSVMSGCSSAAMRGERGARLALAAGEQRHDLVARQVADRRRASGSPACRRDSRIRARRRRRGPWRGRRRRPRGRRPARRSATERMRATFEAKVVIATRCRRVRDELARARCATSRLARADRRRARHWSNRRRAPARPRRRARGSAPPIGEAAEIRASGRASSRRYGRRARAACGWRARSIPGSNGRPARTRCRTGRASRRCPGATSLSGTFGAPGSARRRVSSSRREARRVDRRPQARPQLDERADMVLVRVGDDDAEQVLALLLDEAQIGQDEVDARQISSPAKPTPQSTRIHLRCPRGPKP